MTLIALFAPLVFGGCVSNQAGMKSAALAPKAQAPAPAPAPAPAGPDAYGYAPVKITAFADGSRIALPSQKPDAARLAALPAPAAATPQAAAGDPADGQPLEIAALAADVAERKAIIGRVAPAAVPLPALETVPVPSAAADGKSGRIVSALNATATALNPANAVPATIAAVAKSADAVKVAAIETTGKAVDAVGERLGDTFGGRETITGNAAIDRMIESSAAENGIPSELAYAVVRVESHYNPTAIGGGAYGLSQIKPATARGLGFSGPNSALYDPATNLRYGMKYLAGAWQKSGHDVCGTAMKYKGGHRTTQMSRSAAAYCANVKRHMAAIERRRGPANAGTLMAANQRIKQIALASAPAGRPAEGGILTAGRTGRTVVYRSGTAIAPAAPSDTGKGMTDAVLPAGAGIGDGAQAAFAVAASGGGQRGGRVTGGASGTGRGAGLGLAD